MRLLVPALACFHILLVNHCAASETRRPLLSELANWKLVFGDEFDGPLVDQRKWVHCYWWANETCTNSGNREMQLYRRENRLQGDGVLYLRADYDALYDRDGKFFPFGSGMITSGVLFDTRSLPPRFSFQYGYVEVRAKIPAGKGLWPALWLLPENLEERPEIDIMEILGDSTDKLRMHFHFKDGSGENGSAGKTQSVDDLSLDWHIYGLLWDADKIVWYLDGKEQWRFAQKALVPKEKLYFLANLAVGGEWPGAPDRNTPFPANFLIDYIRIWQSP